MTRPARPKTSPFIKLILTIFIVLLVVYIPLKIYILRSEPRGPVPDGAGFRAYVTNELKTYREPCG